MKRLSALMLFTALSSGSANQTFYSPADLFSPSWFVRISAVESYARLQPGREDLSMVITDLLAEPDPAVRQRVMESLSRWELGRRTTLRAIAAGLEDQDADVRLSAIHAAGTLGHQAQPLHIALEPLLYDPVPELRTYAALALAVIS